MAGSARRTAALRDLAIETVLSLRLVFHLALRQAAGLAGSVLRLLGLDLPVPDHTTLNRRGRAFAGRQPRARGGSGPLHLVLDSTGLELFGQGEWDAAKHGRKKRQWLKLHVAVDAGTGEIAAHLLTEGTADDAAHVPDLLRTVEGAIASLAVDGAYDGEPTYEAARVRQPEPPPDVVMPPRASAVPSTTDPAPHTTRDRHIQLMAEKRRMEWQWRTGYGRRSLAETAMGRYKHLIGPKLRARTLHGQQGEAALAVSVLNRMTCVAKPRLHARLLNSCRTGVIAGLCQPHAPASCRPANRRSRRRACKRKGPWRAPMTWADNIASLCRSQHHATPYLHLSMTENLVRKS